MEQISKLKAKLQQEIASTVKRRQWKQREFAEFSGLSLGDASLLLRGDVKRFRADTLMMLILSFGFDIDINILAKRTY